LIFRSSIHIASSKPGAGCGQGWVSQAAALFNDLFGFDFHSKPGMIKSYNFEKNFPD